MSTRVLVVDDEQAIRQSISAVLRSEGFDVVAAASGEEALRLLEQRAAHVGLIDLMMPGMSGLELARRIRLSAGFFPLVLTSAYHLSAHQVERTGIAGLTFLPKPSPVEALIRHLRGVIREQEALSLRDAVG